MSRCECLNESQFGRFNRCKGDAAREVRPHRRDPFMACEQHAQEAFRDGLDVEGLTEETDE